MAYIYDSQEAASSVLCGSIVDIDTETLYASLPSVEWTVTVTLHPVYSVPAAYIERMWDNNGSSYSLNMCQEVLDLLRLPNTGGGKRTAISVAHSTHSTHSTHNEDHRHYEFGRLTMEIHPITEKPCFSFHLCQLQDIMSMLESSAVVPAGSKVNSHASANQGELYLLNWFALLGPHFGFRMDPSLYKQMAAVLA